MDSTRLLALMLAADFNFEELKRLAADFLGTDGNAISGAVTYVAGQVLRLVCSGNNVSVYYNGVQVGSTVTVSDAGIVSNTRHGKFSTYASNTANYVAA